MLSILLGLFVAIPPAAPAALVPGFIPYQGRLLSGTNVANGSMEMTLRLFAAAEGGPSLYEDTGTVQVVDGLYRTQLGDGTTLGTLDAALTNEEVWLEVSIEGVALRPRERFGAVPYALRAATLEGSDIASGTQGIWRVRSGRVEFAGQDLLAAYAASSAGDTLRLDPGEYRLGGTLALTQQVSLVGAGAGLFDPDTSVATAAGGSLVVGPVVVWPTATNCSLRSLGFATRTADDAVIFANACSAAALNLLMEDLAFYGSGSNAHNCEITGRNIVCRDLRSYNGGSHGLVIKGGSNVVVRGLYSFRDRAQGLLIKSSAVKGDVTGIDISYVSVDGDHLPNAAAGIILDAADSGTTIREVVIRDATVRGNGGWGVILGGLDATRKIENVTFQNLLIETPVVVFGSGLGCSNILFTHCTGLGGLVVAGSEAGSARVRFAQCVDRQAAFGGDALIGMRELSGYAAGVSIGILTNQIRTAFVSTGMLTVVAASGSIWNVNSLATNDPIWIAGSALEGVHRLNAWGVSAANGEPVPGAIKGDAWMQLGTTAGAAGSVAVGEVRPAKAIARLAFADAARSAGSIEAEFVGSDYIVGRASRARCDAAVYCEGHPSATRVSSQTGQDDPAALLPLHAVAFERGGFVYLAVAGGGTPVAAWLPTSLVRLSGHIRLVGPMAVLEAVPDVTW